MVKVSCPVCNSGSTYCFSSLSNQTKKRYTYRKCNLCSHCFIYPKPTQEELLDYYNTLYQIPLDQYAPQARLRGEKHFNLIKKFLKKKDNILEIGCSFGFFLRTLKNKGYLKINGIEPSNASVKYATEKLKLNVKKGIFSSSNQSYDIIFMWHVLEHVSNPKKQLETIYKSLNNNGKLIIEVPNYDSFGSIFFKKYWQYVLPPEHLHLFSIKSLKLALKSSHFKILKTMTYEGDANNHLYNMFITVYKSLQEKNTNNTTSKKKQRQKRSTKVESIKKITDYISLIFYPLKYLCNKYDKGEVTLIVAQKK